MRTDIYIVDNDVAQLDSFRENFNLDLNYKIFTFTSPEMFINKIRTDSRNKTIKIVIIDYLIISKGMNIRTAIELVPSIKSIDSNIEVIILADSDNIELKATNVKNSPTAYVKKDSRIYTVLKAVINRIHSNAKLKKVLNQIKLTAIVFLSLIMLGIALYIIDYYFPFFFYQIQLL